MSHVVVGYDGTAECERALHWAVEEARLRRLPLTVVHVWRWPYPMSYVDIEGVEIIRRMGGHLLEQGVAAARDLAPGLSVRGRLKDGSVAPALLSESQDADVIVIGSHEPAEMPVGSAALRVPARSGRPVVIVRSVPDEGPVVVGVDGSAGADDALAFGFEEAALRGRPLRAVYAMLDAEAVPDGDLSLFDDEDKLRRVCGTVLERAVAPWLVKYPQVRATTSLVMQVPREVLLEAARDAALVTVGARGAGGVETLALGATSDAVLKHAPCAVAVVPRRVR